MPTTGPRFIGNHTLKAGADIRRVRDDLLQGNNNAAAGQFYFQENTTSAPGATTFNGSATGEANDMASILFDVPYKVGQDTNSTFPCYRQSWLFFFVSDKWQAGPKLTVDLGLRYELYPPATPRKAGGFVNYDPTNNSLVIAGEDGNPSNLGMQTDYTNFAPRLGLSYRLTEKTVVRAGFGISYVPFVDNSYAYNYPIKTSTGYTNTPTYGPALNPVGGVINFVTGIPATPTVTFPSNGALVESAANGTIGLSNLLYSPELQECLCGLVELCGRAGSAQEHVAANRVCCQSRHTDRHRAEHQPAHDLWPERLIRSFQNRLWKNCVGYTILPRLLQQL